MTVPTSPGRETPGRPAERRGRPWRVRCGRGPSSSGWSPSRSSSISRPSPRASASTCSTRTDLSRIQMKIWCPVEDEPISRADTVKGYEYAPGEYVVITDEDLENVPLKTVRSIEIEQFTKAEREDANDPLRQERLLPRARQDRPQGVLPAEVGPRGRGPDGHLQGRHQGPRGARRARPVRRHDAPDDAPLARRDPLHRRARPR